MQFSEYGRASAPKGLDRSEGNRSSEGLGDIESPTEDGAARAERPLLADGLRAARGHLDAFHRAEIARDGNYGSGTENLGHLDEGHRRLLEAIRRTETIVSGEETDMLHFRFSDLTARYNRLEQVVVDEGPGKEIAEAAGAYLGTATRLIDALIIVFLDDSEEIEAARTRHQQRVDEGLAIRRAFADFRIALEHGKAVLEPANRIATALTALADLLGSETRQSLRASDRNVFEDLYHRLRTALKEPAPKRQAACEAIYEDLISTTSILSAVNHREELRDRDRKLAHQLPDVLLGPATTGVIETLWEFYGLCAPLDTALAEGQEVHDRHLKALRASLGLP